MNITDIRPGDKLTWYRAGNKEEVEVLEVNVQTRRAKLRVKGWLGEHWEKMTSSFVKVEERT